MITKVSTRRLYHWALALSLLAWLAIWKHGQDVGTGLSLRPVQGRLGLLSYAAYVGPSNYARVKFGDWGSVLLRPPTTSRDFQKLAVIYLADRKSRNAVDCLERALVLNSRDALIWSDLSAAYLNDAYLNTHPYSTLLALRASMMALAIDKDLAPALFNQGLALEAMHLNRQAYLVWERLIILESDPLWLDEARKHLTKIVTTRTAPSIEEQFKNLRQILSTGSRNDVMRAIKNSKLHAREFGEEELLPAWSRSWIEKTSNSEIELSRARYLGFLLESCCGDSMLSDATRSIGRPVSGSSFSMAQAQGMRAYKKGLWSYKNYQISMARSEFARASSQLHPLGNPIANWADFYVVACRYQVYDYHGALVGISRLLARRDIARYPYIIARCLWLRGLINFTKANFDKALDDYRQASKLFRETDEFENVVATDHLMFEVYYILSDKERAWQFITEAISRVDEIADERRRQAIMEGAAIAALDEDAPQIALLFQTEAVRSAVKSQASAAMAATLAWRGLMKMRAGLLAAGRLDIARAKRLAEVTTDASVRAGVLGDVLLAEGEILKDTNPRLASLDLLNALQLYKDTNYHSGLLKTYLALAHVNKSLLNNSNVEMYLGSALEEVQQQSSSISIDSRATFLDDARAALDEMVKLKIEVRHETDSALFYFDNMKASLLLKRLGGGEISPSAPDGAPPRHELLNIPPGTFVVEFCLLDAKLLIWLISGQHRELFQSKVESQELANLIHALQKALTLREGNLSRNCLELLYDRLLRPVIGRVPEGSIILIIPDRILWKVPFSALRDSVTGSFVIERFRLEEAPSLRSYLAATLSARPKRGCEPSKGALSISGLEADPLMPRLSQSDSEAINVSRLFKGSQVLIGNDATKQSFLALAGQFSFLHLVAHAVTNDRIPELSYMGLGGQNATSQGRLYSRDIARMNLKCATLVFLAGCDTGGGEISGSEGTFSLAHAFLMAGASKVVATLWRVGDQSGYKMAELFYGEFQRSGSAADALRRAQMAMIHDQKAEFRSPAAWGSYEVLGSSE